MFCFRKKKRTRIGQTDNKEIFIEPKGFRRFLIAVLLASLAASVTLDYVLLQILTLKGGYISLGESDPFILGAEILIASITVIGITILLLKELLECSAS